MLPRFPTRLTIALLAATGAAVAAGAAAAQSPPPSSTPAASCVAPGGWADGAGKRLDTAALLQRAAKAPAVLLGESHDNAEHHRWQLHTLAALHALNPNLAVGMEMFPRRVQPALDRWSAGALGEEAFLKESDWQKVWGFEPQLYLPILHFARMNRLPVVGLNVERSLVSRTGKEGWAAIPPADREGVGDPAPPPSAYRDRLREVLASHGRGEPRAEEFDRFIEAQSVWDRAMAERIAAVHRDTGRTVVAILGMGHVEDRHGVPHQLAALGMRDAVVLLPWDAARECEGLDGAVADAVYGLGPAMTAETPPQRPRLGVVLESMQEGVVQVRSVSDGSVAAAAGLNPGDVVVAAAGSPVRKVSDLTAVVQRQAPGTWLPLTVKRDQGTQDLVAKFPAQ